MNDQDYIRAGVQLADGWELLGTTPICSPSMTYIPGFDIPECLDALAAQLVRQVDASEAQIVFADEYTDCHSDSRGARRYTAGRTMNTIKAIIDSGVLSEQ